ncbi:hypothetical protein NPIL_309441 [Nephila pilipes]|uniref:Uncharacterized protein n=1 Tax=Nephila pilipes TaxID=299642 RepID=A0A8X6PSW2_NEPPI|nr:hypothetical protein NPIL_309441 [Nephila pilipes]
MISKSISWHTHLPIRKRVVLFHGVTFKRVEGKGGNHLISAGQVLETNYLTPLALHFLRVGDQVIGGSDSVSTCPAHTRTSFRIKRRGLLDVVSYGEILDKEQMPGLISIG